LRPLELTIADLLDDPLIVDAEVTGAQLAVADATGFEITQSRLSAVDLSDSTLPRLQISDATFTDCNLANARTREFSARRSAFVRGKLTGMHAIDGTLSDVEFSNVRLDLAQFTRVTLTRVVFQSCVLREVDFSNVTFDQARFIDCDLSRATFERMRVTNSELRGCTLTGLRGLAQLKGVAMEWNDIVGNAELLAAELGIAIAPERSGA
jgi:uncharacterized protein YjbI with pentapeptide repeats